MSYLTTAPKPGSAQWFESVTASKIPAILELSPYESRYSLWQSMKHQTSNVTENDAMLLGNCFESGILTYFEAKHPGWKRIGWQVPVALEGTKRMFATLDGLYEDEDGNRVIVEVKLVRKMDGWQDNEGEPAVRLDYLAQVHFQLAMCQDADYALVVAFLPFYDIEEFRVDRDLSEEGMVVEAAEQFLESLDNNEVPPLDSHVATYQWIRKATPEIDKGAETELDILDGEWFMQAVRAKKKAETELTKYKTVILDAMGQDEFAVVQDTQIAQRRMYRGVPTLYPLHKNIDRLFED